MRLKEKLAESVVRILLKHPQIKCVGVCGSFLERHSGKQLDIVLVTDEEKARQAAEYIRQNQNEGNFHPLTPNLVSQFIFEGDEFYEMRSKVMDLTAGIPFDFYILPEGWGRRLDELDEITALPKPTIKRIREDAVFYGKAFAAA